MVAKVEAISNGTIVAATLASDVFDAITADVLGETCAELAQGQPPATPTVKQALTLLYMALRNEMFSTPTLLEIKNDAGTVICKSVLSEVPNVSFTRPKLISGP